jgi:hypothetical protein
VPAALAGAEGACQAAPARKQHARAVSYTQHNPGHAKQHKRPYPA